MIPRAPIRRARPSAKVLIAFSAEHLYYEVWMLYGVTEKLRQGLTDRYLYNALLESFVVHASIILDFFYKPQVKPDDAKAIHYLDSVGEWNALLPSYAKYFRRFNTKRNKEVIHLSYKRLDVKPEQKYWRVVETTSHIQKLFDKFLDLANPALIDPAIYQLRGGRA